MKYLTIKNILKRLKSESPTFFKRLRVWMVSLGGLGIALIALKEQYPINMEFFSDQIGGYLLTAGAIGTFLTSLPVNNTQINNIK